MLVAPINSKVGPFGPVGKPTKGMGELGLSGNPGGGIRGDFGGAPPSGALAEVGAGTTLGLVALLLEGCAFGISS